ncbi:MAG TPA: ABC transporter permease [Candidatus Binatia bacterium]|jgi:cell division transport system permease protein
MWSRISFVTRQVLTSLRELFWTHFLTSMTMTMALFVFGVFMLVQENLQNWLKGWGEQIHLNAYLDKSISVADAQEMLNRIRSFQEVEKIRYISQAEAWRDFKASLGAQSGILDGLPEDVLPASFEIGVRPEYREALQVRALAGRIRNEKGITLVEYPQEWVERLHLIVVAVRWAKWIFGGVLFGVTLFIVGSTVKLAILARKDEIDMMQLFGASQEMIEAPFVVEGMTQGLLGGFLSVLCLWVLYLYLRDQIPGALGLPGPFNQIQFLQLPSLALMIGIGWVLGAAGSLASLKRFVRL